MKRFWVIALWMCLLSGCGGDVPPLEGVTRERAVNRQARISQLEYHLDFNVPQQQEDPLFGINTLTFELFDVAKSRFRRNDLWLDFTGNVHTVLVNHQQVPVEQVAEHLRLPGKFLLPGKNTVEVVFTAPDQSLNRRADFLYTLLVPDRARTLFPCFDQPDLKGSFSLRLSVPEQWEAVTNSPLEGEMTDPYQAGKKVLRFAPTEPLSTYLFSFVTGDFQVETYWESDFYPIEESQDRPISIYHREDRPEQLAQLPDIAREVFASLQWLEDYTRIPYPFAKYDLIILPGFQYGGMEHTGATLYNASKMFLEANPTVKEQMARTSLIAHETAHMWFGDYVTMSWFDDVWVKEVFANYFAAEMVKEQFPDHDDRLNFSSYHLAAYSEDRTSGAVSLNASLTNLKDAGLIYSNIVYNKAPILMNMLVDKMGKTAFQQGVRNYLQQYAYGNATWDDLIQVLDKQVPVNMVTWSDVWVASCGMPQYDWQRREDTLIIRQQDPTGQNQVWDQKIRYAWLESRPGRQPVMKEQHVLVNQAETRLVLPPSSGPVLPNSDALGYGLFRLDAAEQAYWMQQLPSLPDPIHRRSILTNFQEMYWHGDVDAEAWAQAHLNLLPREDNQLLFAQLLSQLKVLAHWNPHLQMIEPAILEFCATTKDPVKARMCFLALLDMARTPQTRSWLMACYERGNLRGNVQHHPHYELNLEDRTKALYRLCIYYPAQAQELMQSHRQLLTHPDRIQEFDFISRAVHPEAGNRSAFFDELKQAQNRTVEPWVVEALSLLCHTERQQEALAYLRPGLELLPEIQRTGDIFFPKNWCGALLGGHTSAEAKQIVEEFLNEHQAGAKNKSIHPLLLSKVRQQAHPLLISN